MVITNQHEEISNQNEKMSVLEQSKQDMEKRLTEAKQNMLVYFIFTEVALLHTNLYFKETI